MKINLTVISLKPIHSEESGRRLHACLQCSHVELHTIRNVIHVWELQLELLAVPPVT